MEFVDLTCLTHYPVCSFCVFFYTSLRKQSKARMQVNGLLGNFGTYVEWELVSFSEPRQPPTNPIKNRKPEPTADTEHKPASMPEPEPEPEPNGNSDQVYRLAKLLLLSSWSLR